MSDYNETGDPSKKQIDSEKLNNTLTSKLASVSHDTYYLVDGCELLDDGLAIKIPSYSGNILKVKIPDNYIMEIIKRNS